MRYLIGVVAVLAQACGPAPADLVLRGGAVYTIDSTNPWAQSVAIAAGRIVYVGADSGVTPWIGPGTAVVQLQGKMVLPGFQDSHVHPVTGGMELAGCDLNPARSRADVIEIVRRCATQNPAAPWIRGGGFQLPVFPNGSPSRWLLDSLVPDRPAYLTSADGHSAWVNSRALEIAGVTKDTPDPPNGRIERDRRTGEPGGTLRESAQDLVARHLPARADAEYREGLRRALAMAAQFGITTLHEASASEATLRAYAAAEREGWLTARVIVSQYVDPDSGVAQVARLTQRRDRYGGRLVRANAAKIFMDGVIEGQTAALLQPYEDRPGYRGELNVPPDSMRALVNALDSAGFKVHVHAIGDRAIRVALDAFEALPPERRTSGPRHILAHIQLFHPEDIPRFARLGIVASFQMLWAYADDYMRDLTEPRLGPARSRWLYPIASLMATGAIVAGGSDWSVSSMNPLEAIEVAVTHRAPGSAGGPAWNPDERIDLAAAIRAYTVGSAYAGDSERDNGSLAVGKLADLVVLEHNVFEIPPSRIGRTRVLLTLLEGRPAFQDSSLVFRSRR